MLVGDFEQAFLQQTLAVSAIRVSEQVWQALYAAGNLMRHPSPAGESQQGKQTPQDLFFYKNILVLVDPVLNGKTEQQSFIPFSQFMIEKLSAADTAVAQTSVKEPKTPRKKKSVSAKGFLDRHANRWMGRS